MLGLDKIHCIFRPKRTWASMLISSVLTQPSKRYRVRSYKLSGVPKDVSGFKPSHGFKPSLFSSWLAVKQLFIPGFQGLKLVQAQKNQCWYLAIPHRVWSSLLLKLRCYHLNCHSNYELRFGMKPSWESSERPTSTWSKYRNKEVLWCLFPPQSLVIGLLKLGKCCHEVIEPKATKVMSTRL